MDKLKTIVIEIGASKVAERMGEKFAQTINNWISRGGIPDGKVLHFCKAVDWKVTPHELRPDIYPHQDDGLPAELRKQKAA